MRRLVILFAAALAWAVGPAFAAPVELRILHVNDTHSHLAPWGPKDAELNGTLGGLTRAATLIAAEEQAHPGATVLVHAGDLFQGDLFFNEYLGVPELQLLQALGLDAFGLGNHEFQYGPLFLQAVLNATWPTGTGNVAVLGTNLDFSGFPTLTNWVKATAIKEVSGVKVGFFSLTTPYDPLEQPDPVVIRPEIVQVAQAAVAQLRLAGAQVVVCLSHLGMPLSRTIAAQAPGIDVIINGHDHVFLTQPETVGATTIVSAGALYRYVGRLRLSVDGSAVTVLGYDLLGVDQSVPELPFVAGVVGALQAGIVAKYGDVYHDPLAWADVAITDSVDADHQKRDSPIGNLLTDAYRMYTQTDVAIEAEGFIAGLPQGTLVGADVFRAMAYGWPEVTSSGMTVRPFKLATFHITGAELLKALEIALSTPGGVSPQVSGLRLQYDSTKPAGQQVVPGSVHVNGRKLDKAAIYSVTANEGVLMFLPILGITVSDVQVRDATAFSVVRDYVQQLGVLVPVSQGRLRDISARGN